MVTLMKTNMERENVPWKRKYIYKPSILGFHVSFWGCTLATLLVEIHQLSSITVMLVMKEIHDIFQSQNFITSELSSSEDTKFSLSMTDAQTTKTRW